MAGADGFDGAVRDRNILTTSRYEAHNVSTAGGMDHSEVREYEGPTRFQRLAAEIEAHQKVYLALLAIPYVVGFATSVAVAWIHGLSLPSIANTQYYKIGLAPSLRVAGALIWSLVLAGTAKQLSNLRLTFFGAAVLSVGIASLTIWWLGLQAIQFDVASAIWKRLLLYVVVFVLAVVGVFIAYESPRDRKRRQFGFGVVALGPARCAVLFFFSALISEDVVRPATSGEAMYGGRYPNCVTLDLDASKVTESKMRRLASSATLTQGTDAVAVGPTWLLYARPDILFLLRISSDSLAPKLTNAVPLPTSAILLMERVAHRRCGARPDGTF